MPSLVGSEMCIRDSIQFNHITKILERKYHQLAAKIIRVLREHKTFEDQKINDLFLENIKDVRKYLAELIRDGFISYVELKDKDKAGSQLQMYSYEKQKVIDHIVEETYQTICNMYIRLCAEYKKYEDIIKSPSKSELRQKLEEVVKSIQTYQISLLELDSSLLLFTEY
eukprot:TRINITY_DN11451_c0_g1_i3.p1 TRINITY_DN11451_c0_g1~~TRINITY_DN11451_c0_g1_i3.p1  ORF type:complete len:169 (-),score=29.08 TRINITY_DN11451_c0_g1_i3:294-800(-)